MHRATLALLLAVTAAACGGRFARRTNGPSASAKVDAAPHAPEQSAETLARELDAMRRVEASLDSLRRQRGSIEAGVSGLELGRGAGTGAAGTSAGRRRAPDTEYRETRHVPGTSGAARALDVTIVRFALNSASLGEMMKRLLVEKAEILRAHPSLSIAIVGHADDGGTDEQNQVLSERRADAVRSYLIARGIEAHRLSAAGMGRIDPVRAGRGDPVRSRNRRVEFDVR